MVAKMFIRFSTALVALVLTSVPCFADCSVNFVDESHIIVSMDKPYDELRLCTIEASAPNLRCLTVKKSDEAVRLLTIPKSTDQVVIAVPNKTDKLRTNMVEICQTVKPNIAKSLSQGEVIAALITMFGTNIILFLAFWGRQRIEERRAYLDWIATHRRMLSVPSGSKKENFLPAEDDRFVRAGDRAKRFRMHQKKRVDAFFTEKGATEEGSLMEHDASTLREQLLAKT